MYYIWIKRDSHKCDSAPAIFMVVTLGGGGGTCIYTEKLTHIFFLGRMPGECKLTSEGNISFNFGKARSYSNLISVKQPYIA